MPLAKAYYRTCPGNHYQVNVCALCGKLFGNDDAHQLDRINIWPPNLTVICLAGNCSIISMSHIQVTVLNCKCPGIVVDRSGTVARVAGANAIKMAGRIKSDSIENAEILLTHRNWNYFPFLTPTRTTAYYYYSISDWLRTFKAYQWQWRWSRQQRSGLASYAHVSHGRHCWKTGGNK